MRHRNFRLFETIFWESFSLTFGVALQLSTVFLLIFPTVIVSIYFMNKIAPDIVVVCGNSK